MLHGFAFSKLLLLSALILSYSNASNSQLLQFKGPVLWVGGAHPIKLIVTRLVPDRAINGKSQKD